MQLGPLKKRLRKMVEGEKFKPVLEEFLENLEFNNNQIVYNGRLKYIKETNRFEEKNKISNSNFHLISVLCYINITIILFFQHVYECDKCLNCFVTYM